MPETQEYLYSAPSPSSLFRRSSWPFSISGSASFTKEIIPPNGADRSSSINSYRWRDRERFGESVGDKCAFGENSTRLRPGQQKLLEAFHLLAVVCCPLLDKHSNDFQLHGRDFFVWWWWWWLSSRICLFGHLQIQFRRLGSVGLTVSTPSIMS